MHQSADRMCLVTADEVQQMDQIAVEPLNTGSQQFGFVRAALANLNRQGVSVVRATPTNHCEPGRTIGESQAAAGGSPFERGQ